MAKIMVINLHGNRSGGLTDLVLYGLTETALKGIFRHSPNDQQLHRCKKKKFFFTPEHIVLLVSTA